MKKLKFIIVPVLLLTALVLIGADCGDKSSKKSRDRDDDEEEEKYLTYENAKWGFEIKYPEDWEKEEDSSVNEFAVIFYAPPESEKDEAKENLLVYASTAQPEDFDELMVGLIEDLSGDSYVTLLDYKKVMISGYPGYRASYIYKNYSSSDEIDMGEIQYLHYFVNAGDTWYQILYVALESTYSKYLDQAETMIDSFKIK